MVKLILRKEISRKVVKNIEEIRNNYVELQLPDKLRDEIYDLLDREDDPETQYHSYGIGTGFDSEIVFIDVERFLEQLESEIENNCDEDFEYLGYKEIIKFLDKYKDYHAKWKEEDEPTKERKG